MSAENLFDYGTFHRSRKNLCLWKFSLIKEKSLFIENFLNQGKIFVCEKRSWLQK